MIVTHKIKMDLSRNRTLRPALNMVQGDSNTRALEISLYDNGQPWEIPEDVTVAVAFSKADGTKGLYDKLPDKSNATTIAGNTVTAILAPEVLTCAGQVRVAIVLYDAEMDTLATFTIMVVVEANPAAGEQVSNNYYYLQNMEQVNAAYADILTRLDELKIEAGTEVPANAAEMKALTIGGETFEVVDEKARKTIEGLDVRSITSIKKTSSAGLVDTYTIFMSDGTTETFTVTNGDADDEKIAAVIEGWLDEHPEATTTVQDGSITVEKLSEDLKKSIVNAANSNALTMQVVGQLFEKPEERKYVAWPLGCVQYDAADDTVNVLVNVADTHDMTNDENRPDLYLCKINPRTLDYAMVGIVKDSAVVNQTNADTVTFVPGTKDAYTYGLCIDSNGDYLFMPNYTSEAYLFRSSDHGASWSVTVCNMPNRNDTAFTGLMQTHTGRLIVSTHASYFWYSDDGGANWTKCATPTTHNSGHEACIVELAENELLAVMRKSWSHIANYGAYQVEAAFVCYSHDNGTTWTNGVDSKTITEMSCTGCAIAKIGDRLELYATSRYPHLDMNGVMYQHAASVEDAMADNWSSGKVLTYAKAKHGDDFGYPGCCVDGNGNVHLFWYDADAEESGSVNYYYAQGFSGVSNIPVNADSLSVVSPSLPYSAAMVKQLIATEVAKLNAKINQIIIDGGGTPEQGDGLDGTFYVTDGLYDALDYLDENKRDTVNKLYTGTYGKVTGSLGSDITDFQADGAWRWSKINILDAAGLPLSDGITIEYEVYATADKTGSSSEVVVSIAGVQWATTNQFNVGYLKEDGTSAQAWVGSLDDELWKAGYNHFVVCITPTEINAYREGVLTCHAVFADAISNFHELKNDVVNSCSINGFNSTTNPAYAKWSRIYNRVLTAEEVKNNYTYQKSLRE